MASQPPPSGAMLRPQAVLARELDGFPFAVVVLRVHGSGALADVAYLDDGCVERDVPADELGPRQPEDADGQDTATLVWDNGMAQLAAEDAAQAESAADTGAGDAVTRPASAALRAQGRYEDGAVILSIGVAAAVELSVEAPRRNAKVAIVGKSACGPGLRGIRALRQQRPEVAASAAA
mmetsp:Transcript_32686/g.83316  ORF Transcript_32686/g.83316 Transcript_32686/m.83316 type:complete len:179 (-) Transcript_32686:169-705(-)